VRSDISLKFAYIETIFQGKLMAKTNSAMNSSYQFILWLGLSIFVIIIDQLTKIIALNSLLPNTSQRVNAMMNWVLVFNPGAAFSFLADGLAWQKWFFIGIGLVAAVTILWLLKRHSKESLFCFSLALILGGAVGNLIDRFAYGAVVDFIDVYYQQFHWPAFNVADSAISLGAALLIFDELRRVVKKR